jgi:uncharacterized Tic20 family protein
MNEPVVDGAAILTVETDPEQRKWALFAHLSILIGGLGALVLCIIAAIKANEGVAYRYPLTLRLVK